MEDTAMDKVIEFPCSQAQLLKIILDLETMGKWPAGWYSNGPGRENVRGFIELEVGRKRFTKSGGRLGPPDEHVQVGYFHRVGVLIVGKIGTEISTLFVRSAKPTLRKFFEDLVPVVAEYATSDRAREGTPAEASGAASRYPPPGVTGLLSCRP